MEELIVLILYYVGEILLQSIMFFPWKLVITSRENKADYQLNTFGWLFLSLLVGIGFGYISILILPSAVLSHGWLRLANLIIAPSLAGAIAVKLSASRQKKGKVSEKRFHFIMAFVFTLGVVCTRIVMSAK